MARKLRLEYPGAIFHVMFRGNGGNSIFGDDDDRIRLTERMAESAENFGVRIYLYCWMDNHGHLLVETPKGNLSAFMGSMLTGYTVYFNLRHHRRGHLMQGRFKSVLVAGDSHLMRLSRYIHLNPVHVRDVGKMPVPEQIEFLRKYKWSSYREYIGMDKPSGMITSEPLTALAASGRGSDATRYRRFVESAIGADDREFITEMSTSSVAIGDADFISQIEDKYAELAQSCKHSEDVTLRHVKQSESPEAVISDVCGKLNISKDDVLRSRRDATNRAILALALLRRSGLTRREIAETLNLVSGTSISYLVKKANEAAKHDTKLKKLFNESAT
jgi:Transposase and inactivated derivatives